MTMETSPLVSQPGDETAATVQDRPREGAGDGQGKREGEAGAGAGVEVSTLSAMEHFDLFCLTQDPLVSCKLASIYSFPHLFTSVSPHPEYPRFVCDGVSCT